MQHFDSVRTVARELRPFAPQHVFRPSAITHAVTHFQQHFAAKVMYAVKTNPESYVLDALHAQGINRFDVASIDEVRLIRSRFPDAELFFMHTVKSRQAIAEAYHEHGVRAFSLDTHEELHKIMAETGNAKDLRLFVRMAIPNSYSEISLADKFGATSADAVELLKATRPFAHQLGVCFHVGSQCMHPDAYRIAIRMAYQVIRTADVKVEALDVGGGFPSIYPGMMPPPLTDFFSAIEEEFAKGPDHANMELYAEPGRALVAESGSVLVRVELRKQDYLYINDGTYGSLFDAGTPQFIFPTSLMRDAHSANVMPYSFFGPTCDTLDFMKGPFYLADDIVEGDYIEIGQLGAYSRAMMTSFNGFGPTQHVVAVDGPPLMSVYQGNQTDQDMRLMAA